jgi:KaiC/GvpD/RAD55 family RecA-like ATPase
MIDKWNEEKIIAALDKNKQFEAKAEEILKEFKSSFSMLLILKPESYKPIKNFILNSTNTKWEKAIFVSVNATAEKILEEMDKKSQKKFFVIDMFSGKSSANENYAKLDSATQLAECLDIIESNLSKRNEKQNAAIIIDSISSLLLYNNPEAVKKFLHLMISKSQSLKVSVILLGIEEKDYEGFYKIVSQFVDSTISF